jgi:hypothetical protein
MKSIFLIIILHFFSIKLFSQNLEYRSVNYYFDIVDKLEIEELKKSGLINDSLEVIEKYREKGQKSFNDKALNKYVDIKLNIYQSFFKDYLYQQHIEYQNEVYVLYFTMAGFDDIEWQILRWNKNDWDKSDKIDLRLVQEVKNSKTLDQSIIKYKFEPIIFNYDEGPKNSDNVRLFIKNNYLILERGNLYHSLYDMKSKKVLVNDESPWASANANDKEGMNKWIKINLHDKINKIINL